RLDLGADPVGVWPAGATQLLDEGLDPADLEGAADLVEGVQVVAHQPAGLGDGSWASWSSGSFRRVLWDMAGHSECALGSGCLSNFHSPQRAGGRLQCLSTPEDDLSGNVSTTTGRRWSFAGCPPSCPRSAWPRRSSWRSRSAGAWART